MAHTMLKGLIHQHDFGKFHRAVNAAVTASIVADYGEHWQKVTRAEVKRRFDMCCRIVEVLKGDLKWGTIRALDHVPRFLRDELNGVRWEPKARAQSWIAGTHETDVTAEDLAGMERLQPEGAEAAAEPLVKV